MTASESMRVKLRNARADDEERIFQWRNLPHIVGLAANARRVDREEHRAWFEKTLQSDKRLLFIISAGGEEFGVLRFDRAEADTAVLSVFLLPSMTGRGLGVEAIRLGTQLAFRVWEITRIHAFTRSENTIAIRAFKKAGFEEFGDPSGSLRVHHLCRPVVPDSKISGTGS